LRDLGHPQVEEPISLAWVGFHRSELAQSGVQGAICHVRAASGLMADLFGPAN